MFSDNISDGEGSTHQLIPPPKKDMATPFSNYKDDLDQALEEDEDHKSTTSFI